MPTVLFHGREHEPSRALASRRPPVDGHHPMVLLLLLLLPPPPLLPLLLLLLLLPRTSQVRYVSESSDAAIFKPNGASAASAKGSNCFAAPPDEPPHCTVRHVHSER